MVVTCDTQNIDDIEDITKTLNIEGPVRENGRKYVPPKAKRLGKVTKSLQKDTRPVADSIIPGTQKIYVKTWGCSHNNSDSEYMAGQLASFGYKITVQKDTKQSVADVLAGCAKATSAEDQESRSETQREKRRENSDHHDHHLQKNDKCDPSLHYYERPVYNVEVASTKNSKNGSASQKDSNLESRQKVNLGASKTKHEPVYEVIDPEIILAESGAEPNKITQRDCNENRRLPEKLEDERIQGHGTPSQRNSFKSKDRTSQVASRVRDEGPGEEIGNQRFSNVAASIDPTFRGDVKEEAPGADDRIWVIGDSGIRVSSNSKPEPLIQNTRRKQSKDKSAKDKEKCKQQ
eukprot:gene6954-12575_t